MLLGPSVGGLTTSGILDHGSDVAADVSAARPINAPDWVPDRQRLWDDGGAPDGMRLIRVIDTTLVDDEQPAASDESGTASPPGKVWRWYVRPLEAGRSTPRPVAWEVHVNDVMRRVQTLVQRLELPEEIQAAFLLAARYHDHGKLRRQFQTLLGNLHFTEPMLAKSGRYSTGQRETYRHEFGSLLNLLSEAGAGLRDWRQLSPELQDLTMHLIAAHHGRARPHFPSPEEDFDPEPPAGVDAEAVALETPRRFARLQRRYGRWGLAYLESLLRAADWAASASPTEFLNEDARTRDAVAQTIAEEVT
ncbi:MAG: CRISPR-associated endonuclease Cas3'' [Planctomycetaceae bacterium]